MKSILNSLRALTVLRGVVAPCYNKVPQLHATQSEPLDYVLMDWGSRLNLQLVKFIQSKVEIEYST